MRIYLATGLPTIALLASGEELRRELNTKIDVLTGKVYERMAKHDV